MPKTWLTVTVEWPQYFTYCLNCSRVYIDMRDSCYCEGERHLTRTNHKVMRAKTLEPIARFMVRFQQGRIVK